LNVALSFWSAFVSNAERFGSKPFLIDAERTLTYGEALEIVYRAKSSKEPLTENSISSIISWLVWEKKRDREGLIPPTDYVQTSGSTGKPKQFLLPAEAQWITANAINSEILQHQALDEIILLPLTHSSARGRLRAAVLRGASIYVSAYPFSFRGLNSDFLKQRPFATCLTPSTFRYMVARLKEEFWSFFSQMKSLEFGSSSLRQAELIWVLQTAPASLDLRMHYGLTEASRSFIRNLRFGAINDLGNPMPHVRYRLGGDGELFLGGPHLAQPVDSQKTGRLVAEIATGDLCEIVGSDLRLIGRKKNVINVGGYSVSSEAIEFRLECSAPFSHVVVVGQYHELLGEVPAIVVGKGEKGKAMNIWRDISKEFHSPVDVNVFELEELPLIGPGKLDRLAIRTIVTESS
jgi:acyl-CoA synthetase (AMP-forming)/AMP-acid ligase II